MIRAYSSWYPSLPRRARPPIGPVAQVFPANSQRAHLQAVADFSETLESLEADPPSDATSFIVAPLPPFSRSTASRANSNFPACTPT
jgi:hypothetical protein